MATQESKGKNVFRPAVGDLRVRTNDRLLPHRLLRNRPRRPRRPHRLLHCRRSLPRRLEGAGQRSFDTHATVWISRAEAGRPLVRVRGAMASGSTGRRSLPSRPRSHPREHPENRTVRTSDPVRRHPRQTTLGSRPAPKRGARHRVPTLSCHTAAESQLTASASPQQYAPEPFP